MTKRQGHLDRQYWFDSSNRQNDIKSKSINGGISTTANQIASFGLNLISTFVLARILLPSDFGLIGMVTAFTGFAEIIKDVGLSMAVIQKENITHYQVSNLFWVNVVICLSIAFIFVLVSPLIVSLYHHDARIYPILFSYSIGIFISGFSIQHMALLNRKMMFSHLAKGSILATILSVVFGISAGILGLGYWSIVILNLSLIIFNTLFIWILCNWRPSWPKSGHKIDDLLHFGAAVSGFNIASYISRNSDNILIGKYIGSAAVGLYSKAYQLLMMPINQIRNPLMAVAISAMSALKTDSRRYVTYYRKYVFLLAFFSMPLVAYLAIFANELILIVLGERWLACVPIFRVLAIAGFIQPVSSSGGLVMMSQGHARKYFIIGCVSSLITVLGFIIGIHWGVIGTVIAFTVTAYLILVPTLIFSFAGTPIKISMFFSEISAPMIHAIIMSIFLLLLKGLLIERVSQIIIFLIAAPLGAIFYYFSWEIYALGRKRIAMVKDLISSIASKLSRGKQLRLLTIFNKKTISKNSDSSHF